MSKCPSCGAEIESSAAFCPYCGKASIKTESRETVPASPQSSYRLPKSEGGYSASSPVYAYSDPAKEADRVLGTGSYLGAIILMNLPIVGFIMQIVWSCGACRSKNLRHLARAFLIISIVGLLLAFVAGYRIYSALPEIIDGIQGYIPDLGLAVGL